MHFKNIPVVNIGRCFAYSEKHNYTDFALYLNFKLHFINRGKYQLILIILFNKINIFQHTVVHQLLTNYLITWMRSSNSLHQQPVLSLKRNNLDNLIKGVVSAATNGRISLHSTETKRPQSKMNI